MEGLDFGGCGSVLPDASWESIVYESTTSRHFAGELAVVDSGDEFRVRVAAGGFLAGYSGLTLDAYGLDVRQWLSWCAERDLGCLLCDGSISSCSPVISRR